MSTAVLTNRLELSSVADSALKAATRFWFGVTVIGQLMFAFAVASFFGVTALRGDFHGWSRFISRGYVSGDTMGNFAVVLHVGSAVVIMLAGAVQLIPGIRNRFPVFHRWNGRIYMLMAVSLSIAGLYCSARLWRCVTLWLATSKPIAGGRFACSLWRAPRGSFG